MILAETTPAAPEAVRAFEAETGVLLVRATPAPLLDALRRAWSGIEAAHRSAPPDRALFLFPRGGRLLVGVVAPERVLHAARRFGAPPNLLDVLTAGPEPGRRHLLAVLGPRQHYVHSFKFLPVARGGQA